MLLRVANNFWLQNFHFVRSVFISDGAAALSKNFQRADGGLPIVCNRNVTIIQSGITFGFGWHLLISAVDICYNKCMSGCDCQHPK